MRRRYRLVVILLAAATSLIGQPSEQFLHHILFHTEIGYTLLGHKPMTEEIFPCISDHHFVLKYYIPRAKDVEEFAGFVNANKRYRAFLTKTEHDVFLVVLNDREVERVVKENFSTFAKYLGQNCLCKLMRENPFDVCRKYDELLGILFGYGPSNSFLWKHSSVIYREYKQFPAPSRFQPEIEMPRFVGLDFQETQSIVKTYKSDGKEIAEALKAKSTIDYLKAKMQGDH